MQAVEALSRRLTVVKAGRMSDRAAVVLHPLLAGRWSPTVFDAAAQVSAAEVELLVEAARWAPSAGNSQPWAFILGRRGDPTHRRLVRHLAGSSAHWAPTASLLVANLCHRYVEDTDWDYSEFALYDLGQAVAHLTVQARALGPARPAVPGVRPGRRGRRVRGARPLGGHHDVGHRPGADERAPTRRRPDAGRPRLRRPVDDLVWPTAYDGG